MKKKFKIGDKVYATGNEFWGKVPMVIVGRNGSSLTVASETFFVCAHPKLGHGGFDPVNLELVTPERTKAIKEFLRLEKIVQRMVNKLWYS